MIEKNVEKVDTPDRCPLMSGKGKEGEKKGGEKTNGKLVRNKKILHGKKTVKKPGPFRSHKVMKGGQKLSGKKGKVAKTKKI